MVKQIITSCLMLFAVSAFAQYKGGSGDGFTTAKISITTSINQIAIESKMLFKNNVISLQSDELCQINLYALDGKLILTDNSSLDVSGQQGLFLYQIIFINNQMITGKLWLE
jgi:hypothetical protein